jgi:DNA-binding CsgD family transcriptional regulator
MQNGDVLECTPEEYKEISGDKPTRFTATQRISAPIIAPHRRYGRRSKRKQSKWVGADDLFLRRAMETVPRTNKKKRKFYAKLAQMMGRTVASIKARCTTLGINRRNGASNMRSKHTWTPEEKQQLVELRQQGKTYGEIAQIMGMTDKAVYIAYKRKIGLAD